MQWHSVAVIHGSVRLELQPCRYASDSLCFWSDTPLIPPTPAVRGWHWHIRVACVSGLLLCSSGRSGRPLRKTASSKQAVSVGRRGSSSQQPGGPAALGLDVVVSYDIPLAQDLKDIRCNLAVTVLCEICN